MKQTPLKKCRNAEGITLRELADECGLSKSTLSRLENGQTSNVYAENCLKVLNRYADLGLTLENLIHPEKHTDFEVSK